MGCFGRLDLFTLDETEAHAKTFIDIGHQLEWKLHCFPKKIDFLAMSANANKFSVNEPLVLKVKDNINGVKMSSCFSES